MPSFDFAGNPLVNDDRNLTPSRPIDFAGNPAGLDLSRAPTGAAPTLQGMPNMDMSGFQQQLQSTIRAPQTAAYDPSGEPMFYYSPSTGDMVVNGFQFNQRNATQALASRQFASQPRQQFTLPDTASDWRAMSPEEYNSYLSTIEHPTFGRRMGEAWENAWRGMGDIAVGAGLAIDQATTGDEDNQWLLQARANLTREFEENAPFMMQLRDIKNPGDAMTYFSQMLVQGAPWLVETAVSMGIGALVGGAASGGVGAPAGAIEAFIAKEGLRAASRQLLRNNLARGARIYAEAQAERGAATLTRNEVVEFATRTGADVDDVNRFFNFGERAYHMSRSSIGGSGFAQAGQVVGMGASNYLTGVGDIRNSIADAGGDTESADAVANIWGLAIPYAFVESMGDLLITQPISQLLPGMANGSTRIGNALAHAGIVGTGEGIEEGSQYLITQQGVAGATNRPIDIEPLDLLENVVGGAIAGAGLGGVTGAMGTPNRVTPPATPTTPAEAVTPGPASPAPVTGMNTEPETDPSRLLNPPPIYMGSDPMYRDTGMQAIGGLDLNQDPTDTDPNYVGIPEQQAMRNNAIMDVGPTTVTPPAVAPQVQRTPEEIFRDLDQSKRIAPQEFQVLRDFVRQQQLADPTNPAHTDLINYINDAETEQNTVEPAYDWSQPELQPTDGLPTFGPHRLQSYRDKNGKPTGRAAPEYVDPVIPNTDKLGVTRDQMGRVKGITASMEGVHKNITTLEDVLDTSKFRRPRAQRQLDADGKPLPARRPKREKLSKEAQRAYNRMEAQAKKIAEQRVKDREAAKKAADPERNSVIDKFGADSHNAWLKNFRESNPAEADKPRMRERGGAMVDVNQPWDKLDDRAKADNAVAAGAAYDAYKAHPDDIEAGSAMIHDAWVERNKKDKSIDKALLEPYAKLSEEEKEKDRAHWRRVRDTLNPPKPKRNRIKEVAQRAKEARDAVPERSAETTPAQNKPRVVQEAPSRDTADTGTTSKSTDSARTESVQSAEVNQTRVDKAIAALEYLAKKRGASMKVLAEVTKIKQHAAALASNLSQSDKAVAEGKKPRNINRDMYSWYFNNELNRADLKAVIDYFKNLAEGLKADKPKASSNAKRAQAFHSQVMEEWTRADKNPEVFSAFVLDPKYREEVENWINTETISKLAVKIRNVAKEILETTQNPKRATGDESTRGSLTSSEREELRKLDEFIFALYRPEQVPDVVLDRYNELARRAPKGIILAGRPITRAELEREQDGIDREVDEELDNSSYGDFLAESGEKPSRAELDKQYAKDLAELNTLREQNTRKSSDGTDENPKRAIGERPDVGIASKILRRELDKNPNFTLSPVHPAARLEAKKIINEINNARERGGLPPSSLRTLTNQLAQLRNELDEKPKRAVGDRLSRRIIDVRTPDGPSKIYVNPTRDDVMRMTKTPLGQAASKYDMVRYIRDAAGNVFMANGYYFIHDQIVDVVESKGILVVGYESDLGNIQMGHGNQVVASSFTRQGDKLVFSQFSDVKEETLWPKRSVESRPTAIYNTVTESAARKTVEKIQRNINKDVRFKTTHIMSGVMDIFTRGNEEMMTAPNGAQVSLMSYIMRQAMIMQKERPEFKDLELDTVAAFYVQDYMQAHAFVVPGYNALFVFTNYIKDNDALLRTLEHEYIVHGGLSALFSSTNELDMFLERFGRVPGVEKMRLHLLATKPEYGVVSRHRQLEEVLAFHSMHGPLAVQVLLSAEEGVDQATRRTLWEDFKQMVRFWLAKVFGIEADTNSTADIMDNIVEALRQHAIVGTSEDLMSILDKRGVPKLSAKDREDFLAGNREHVKRAVAEATATPAETQEKLMGTETDPLRPYRPRDYVSDTIGMLEGNEPLIEKLSAINDRNVATPIKEGLKKVGRELVTMNDMALKSVLIEKMMRIMHNTIKYARNIMTRIQEQRQYMSKSAKTARLRAIWGDKFPGSTPEQLEAANRMMLIATNNRIATLSDAEVRNAPRLRVRNLNGTYTINTEVYKEMLKRGTISKEEFLNGVELFTVDKKGELTTGGIAKLPKEVIELGYEIYKNESKLMAESALQTLESMNEALSMRNENSIEQILRDIDLKEKDQPFVREALLRMRKLYADIAFHNYSESGHTQRYSQQEMGYQVMVELQRAFHEELKVKDWTDSRAVRKDSANPRANDAFKWREQVEPHKDVEPFVDQIRWFLEYDDTLGQNRMEHINSVGVNKDQQFDIMNVFQSLINAETQAYELENDVIQSVMGNYVEMTRNGEWRVALEVRSESGKEFSDANPQVLAALPVSYVESKREARALQQEWAETFAGVHTIRNSEGKEVKVTFDVSMAMAPGTKTMGDAPKVREFLKVAELAGMTLKPHQMKVIANLIESAATRKRLGLQRAGTPGADINVLQNNSQTMTRRAWQAAKTSQAWMLESTMTDRKNQYGDWDYLALLQQKFDIANRGAPEGSAPPVTFRRSAAAVTIAEKELLRYAEQLRHMARHTMGRPTVNVRTTKGELKLKITGEAEAFTTHAQALKASLEKGDVEVNLNDMLSKTGALRQMAVVSQLGTIAAGIMNAFTPLTHLPWRLSANHEKTGYGEGFNLAEIASEIGIAAAQVGNLFKSLADSVALKKILDDAKAGNTTTHLTLAELEALYQETLNGVLMPQQTYSLTGGTESNITNLLTRNLMTMLLGPFSAVEAATRRVSFLVAYRLMKARYIAAGVSEDSLNDPTSPEYKKLMEEIERVVFDTQGDYSNVNRPRSFRGDWAQYILQYKMFPLNTIMLIKNLPNKEKAMILGTIFLLSGLKGEPFADDFADIYDTLLQGLGFKHDSVELQLTQTLEKIMPGSSNWIMHGGVDSFIPIGATISSRLSMGDIIPLTGVLRPEADVGRELTNALGPAFAANWAAVEYAGTLADFMLQTVGAKPRTTSWENMLIEAARQFPQGQIRAFTEAGMMAGSGQIVDSQGRLVSDNVNPINIFSRALAFYPLEASKANTAVRLDRMHTGYMRAIRARFILAYANAYRAGNRDEMDRINDAVNDWNDAVEQTGQTDMHINNFRTAAVRAGRAASSTTVERTSQGAPDYSLIDELAGIINADTESDDE